MFEDTHFPFKKQTLLVDLSFDNLPVLGPYACKTFLFIKP